LLAVLGLLSLSCGDDSGGSTKASPTAEAQGQATQPSNTQPAGTQPAATQAPAAKDLKLFKVSPDNGSSGTKFTLSGDGLPADKDAEIFWATVDGGWDTTATPENIQFNKRVYKDKRISLGKVHIDSGGKLTGTATVPDDFGEVHDIYLAVDGQDVGKSGFRIMRKVTISPEQGPIGTPISIKVTGLSWSQYTSVISIRYDNQPLGIITAVETHGTATGLIRASGTVGKHVIDVDHGARSVPFLNNQQSGTANIPDWRFTFTVTDDKTVPPTLVEWPDPSRVAKISTAAPTSSSGKQIAGNAKASLTPNVGPILSSTTLTASGVSPNTSFELFWVTARGNRTSPTGWSLTDSSLGKKTSGADGSLTMDIQIPDDLGGWHVMKLVGGDSVVAEVPYFVQRSLVGLTPEKVKAGDPITLHLKGVGWTEIDNGVAITYDNGYIGFACGFNSNGDVTVNLVATGAPGIHLIDVYPMIYQGHGESPWGYQQPLLAFKEDAPGLGLGYGLPAFRLAIVITE
jgi:hypothetical protein